LALENVSATTMTQNHISAVTAYVLLHEKQLWNVGAVQTECPFSMR
jgi:hypothetical protein